MKSSENKQNKFIHIIKNYKSAVLITVVTVILIVTAFILVRNFQNRDISKYNIVFESNGGSLVEEFIVDKGKSIIKPKDPIKDDYEFIGWYYNDELYDFSKPVTDNIKLEARWNKIERVSKIVLNKTNLTLELRDTYQLISTVEPENANNKNVIWQSSNTDIVSVDSNGNIKALKEGTAVISVKTEDGGFIAETIVIVNGARANNNTVQKNEEKIETKNNYIVSFCDESGAILSNTQLMNQGEKVIEPKEPQKEGYTFLGWYNKETKYTFTEEVKENITLIAKWEKNKYKIVFMNDDYSILQIKIVEHGDMPICDIPTSSQAEDEKFTYTFAGWSPSITLADKYTTYTATYTKSINKHEVTFKDEDGIILSDTKIIEHGNNATEPTQPVKEGYTFQGWYNGEKKYTFEEEVKENITLTAKWEKNKYTITFINGDGTVLETQTVEYGVEPIYSEAIPIKVGDEQYTYTFEGWNPNIKDARENTTYTATYKEILNKYEVAFKDEDGATLLETQIIEYGNKAIEPLKPEKEGHTFQGWYNGETKYTFTEEVRGNVTLTAKWEKNKYTITFVNEHGTTLSETQIIEYGNKAIEPLKPEKVGHIFQGWYNGETKYTFTEEVKENITLTAKWEKCKYTITFVNEDGTILETQTVEHGTMPTYLGTTPTKAGNEQYTYIFTGWNPEIKEAIENATYTATYTESINKYEVKFKDKDGTTLSETQTIEYGNKATEPLKPEKEGHTFQGWYTGETKYTFTEEVKENITLTAKWEKNKYTITFVNEDGTTLSEAQIIEYGNKAIEPVQPIKEGHTFKGWYNGETKYTFTEEVKENITLTAKWEKSKYTITFVNEDGTILETKMVEYGAMPIYTGKIPTKTGNEQYTYIFTGWNPEIKETIENATYTATYKGILNKYEVAFKDEDGTTLSETQIIEYGNKATEPSMPEKEGHRFQGWYNGEKKYTFTEEVKGNLTLIAKWEKNKYTITFVNEDGTILETQTVEHGTMPTYLGTTPTKTGNEQYTYIFTDWNPSIKEATENATYTATYTGMINKYEVVFKDEDGTTLSETQIIEYGNKAIEPSKPEKEGHTFQGWYNGETKYTFTEEVKENIILTAKWEKSKYTIIFVNEDGTILETQTVEHGTMPTYSGTTPTKAGNEQYTYIFTDWNPSIKEATENATYTATYTGMINKYEVVFKDEDGTTLSETQIIEYGNKATEPSKPEKEGHTFQGWYNGDTKYTFTEEVKENITLTAKWEKSKYTITFVNEDGTILESQTVEHGTKPTYTGATPTKEANAQYTYIFTGWNPEIKEARESATYTATYKRILNKYEVAFKDEDGTTLSETQTVEYGNKATEPLKPEKEGYVFQGWYNGETKYTFTEEVKESITLIAKWEKCKYTITFVNEDGTILETQTVEHGVMPLYTGKTPTKATDSQHEYIFVGWTPTIIVAEKDATYTACFKYLVDVDKEINNALSEIDEIAAQKFTVVKDKNNINVKFTKPDDVINMFYEIVKLFDSLSCNEDYETFELYYKHEGHSKGEVIDLTKYNLKDTSLGSWYGNGANDRVGDWLGYLASGTASTTAAFNAHTNDLLGKTVDVTIKLKEGNVNKDGSETIKYYLNF